MSESPFLRLRAFLGAVLLSCTLLPLGAAAQEDTAGPANTGFDYPELIAFLRSNTDLAAELEALMREAVAPGEKLEGWAETGVDPAADLSALPGGLAHNFLFDADPAMRSFLAFAPLSALFEDGYRSFELWSARESPSADGPGYEASIAELAQGIWLEVEGHTSIIGKARCSRESAGRLHTRRPLHSLTEEEMGKLVIFAGMADLLSRLRVCSTYARMQDGRWIGSSFTPEGERLPVLDEAATPMLAVTLDEVRLTLAGS